MTKPNVKSKNAMALLCYAEQTILQARNEVSLSSVDFFSLESDSCNSSELLW